MTLVEASDTLSHSFANMEDLYSTPGNHTALKLRKLPVQQQNENLARLWIIVLCHMQCMGNSAADLSFYQKQM